MIKTDAGNQRHEGESKCEDGKVSYRWRNNRGPSGGNMTCSASSRSSENLTAPRSERLVNLPRISKHLTSALRTFIFFLLWRNSSSKTKAGWMEVFRDLRQWEHKSEKSLTIRLKW